MNIKLYLKAVIFSVGLVFTFGVAGLYGKVQSDTDTAITDLSRQIELNDSDAELYLLRGNLHMNKQDYGLAVNDYTKAIEINPDDAAAYNNRGQAYVNMWEERNYNICRRANAIMREYNNPEEYRQAMKDRKQAEYSFQQFMEDRKQADKDFFKQAIKDYKKAIKKDPENIYAYINRGNAYCVKQQYQKAISDYTGAIKIDPENSLAYIYRGNAYHQESNFGKAIKDLSKALELDVRDAGIYLLRGNAYHSNRKYRQAINDYSKALEINPDLINAYNNRGMAYEGLGELNKAILEYSKAIEIISENPDAFINPNFISKEEQNFNTVRFYRTSNIYRNKYDSFPGNYKDEDINGTGYISSRYGIPAYNSPGYSSRRYSDNQVLYSLTLLLSFQDYMVFKPLESYINRGLAYEKKNQLDKAISDFSRVIEIYPNHALAYLCRAEVYHKIGNEIEYKNDFNIAKKYGYKSRVTKPVILNPKGYWEESPDSSYYNQAYYQDLINLVIERKIRAQKK